MDAFFERMLSAVVKNDEYWIEHKPGGELNNHYAWHKLCRCMIGLFYNRPELVEQAMHGPYGVEFMLRHGFTDDGLWLEGSIPYQFAATDPLLMMARITENAGHEASLLSYETSDGHGVRESYDALFGLLFPDRTLPPIGDAYARRPHMGANPSFEKLYSRCRDPKYAWLLRDFGKRQHQALFEGVPDLPDVPPPAQRSRLWPEHGYAALRSVEGEDYWSGRGYTVFATWSNSVVHQHADKLSIMLFADGRLWLPDLEARSSAEHAFSSKVQTELNRHILCHNTLMVNGEQRHPIRLELIEYQVLPNAKRLTMGDLRGEMHPGVRQMRTIVVRPEYVLDIFQAESDEPQEYSWLVHVDGKTEDGSVTEWASAELPCGAAWSYLRNPEASEVSGPVWEIFTNGEASFRMDLLTDGPVEFIRCGFPKDDSTNPATVPMRIVRARRQAAWFAAVYRSGGAARETLQLCLSPGQLRNWDVSVTIGTKAHMHRIPRLADIKG